MKGEKMVQRDNLQLVAKNIERNEQYMRTEMGVGTSYDVDFRELIVLNRKVQLYYINGLVDDKTITEILKKLVEVNDFESEADKMFDIIKNRLVNQQVDPENKMEKVAHELLSGLIIVFVDGERTAFIVDVRHYPGRQPEEPDTERVIRGSRDGFTENIVENAALTRRRVKDKRLRNELVKVGTRSKTEVSISYIDTIVNEKTVKAVKNKLKKIDIDGVIMVDKALNEFFGEKKWTPLSLVRFTERPDVAGHLLLSGFLILMVDTSPNVIIVPTTFFDHLEHAEEFRQVPIIGTMTRWIRILAVLSSVFLVPVWLLFVLEPSLLPENLSFIGPDKTGNIPIGIQIILAFLGVEFLRMAAIHTPTPLATALGLIAAVLIGDIAVDVGLFNAEVILYVAVSTIGSYVTPSYELSVANKFIELWFIIAILTFGMSGFMIALTVTIIYLVQLKTIDAPYFWPLIPFDRKSFLRLIFRLPVPYVESRPKIVFPKNVIRQK